MYWVLAKGPFHNLRQKERSKTPDNPVQMLTPSNKSSTSMVSKVYNCSQMKFRQAKLSRTICSSFKNWMILIQRKSNGCKEMSVKYIYHSRDTGQVC